MTIPFHLIFRSQNSNNNFILSTILFDRHQVVRRQRHCRQLPRSRRRLRTGNKKARQLEKITLLINKWDSYFQLHTFYTRQLEYFNIICIFNKRASFFNNNLYDSLQDKCCRAHDHCPVKVKSFSTNYGAKNNHPYTK